MFGKCFVWAWFRQTCLCSSMWGGYRIQIALERTRYFFLQVGEICKKSRQRCSSTVPLPVKHRHRRMWRLGFTLIIVGMMNTSTARLECATLITFEHHVQYYYRQTPRHVVVVCCQSSTTFKLPPPGMRGSLGLE